MASGGPVIFFLHHHTINSTLIQIALAQNKIRPSQNATDEFPENISE